MMTGAGATYLFSAYSKYIKTSTGYDLTLNLLLLFKDLGANVGVLSGLIVNYALSWFVLLLGSALTFGGPSYFEEAQVTVFSKSPRGQAMPHFLESAMGTLLEKRQCHLTLKKLESSCLARAQEARPSHHS
ncbi:hypothetical protein R6Q59_012115 [Mikania micrantha]